jgi:anti-sigma factor RsiW
MSARMQGEQQIGGVWCSEVLALLTRFLDGDLGEDELAVLKAHVGGCSRCAQFGGAFQQVIGALRRVDADDEGVDLSGRVLDALD